MLDVHWDGGFGDVGVRFNVEGKPADSVCAGAAISPGGNDVMDDDWSSIMAGDRSLRQRRNVWSQAVEMDSLFLSGNVLECSVVWRVEISDDPGVCAPVVLKFPGAALRVFRVFSCCGL
jgi:hypothetical protein